LQKAIICSKSKRPFRIVKAELEFHRKHGIALPHTHPNIRHQEKIKKRPSKNFELIECMKCNKKILANKINKNILCKDCYNKEVY
jgi:formylmethanofuran dehydrogenase subunit E